MNEWIHVMNGVEYVVDEMNKFMNELIQFIHEMD